MEARSNPIRWTYEEFAALPRHGGKRFEIIAGELVVSPSPSTFHQIVLHNLILLLGNFVRKHELGWILPGTDVLFAEGDYLEPDIAFIRCERREIMSKRAIESAPDMVVEILSPSTTARDRGIKRERYALYGVSEYWIVDIDAERIERFRLAVDPESPDVATESVTWQPIPERPALTFPMSEVFRDVE